MNPIRPLRIRVVALIFLLSAAGFTIGLRLLERHGTDPVRLSGAVVVVLLLAAVAVAALGLRIRRWIRRGEHIDPIGATRTLVLGQAAGIAGALQAGYCAGQVLVSIPRLPAPEPQLVLVTAAAALVAALALAGAGLLAQWCCRIPPDDDEPENRPPGPPRAA
ncbi:DUF3180 family protein [Pseudactinotalea sp. HY160]|uniref:DUF3180 domain-containing protein n=1 Tax=Pseudactinotalea sp. HY160 TaxID=2654490 RepID=UPI00128E08F0|nr:DUF3180 domain-containing protein [Pseudactinotalea sp. HY160]MPV48430.1 DUF3180 family protein [Pseudactinotalea sp. HY160]